MVTAPMNPEYVKYLEDLEAGRVRMVSEDGHWLGLIPSTIDRSHLRSCDVGSSLPTYLAPSSYDLRAYGRVSPVKDQGQCGSCWTFGALASLV